MLEVFRNVFYVASILSVTVCWTLAAVFLAKTETTVNAYYNGSVMLLAFGCMAMLVLPILAVLGSEKHRKDIPGVIIAESIIIFIFWCLFLSGPSKFTSEYTSATSFASFCGYFSYCGIGRSVVGWGWISFFMITVLFVIALAYSMFDLEGRKNENKGEVGNRAETGGAGLVPLQSNDPRGVSNEEEKKKEVTTSPAQ
ncbi:hypothetical protein JCM5350_005136 [Sporobolomyces pararoseus]